MIYVVSKSYKPQFNIAMEEYCFTKLTQYDKVFMLWINEPSIIVGKHQNTLQEVNMNYVRNNGIHIVRRITGGGAVYHDHNNLNYTIISNEKKGAEFDFKTFSEPVIETLSQLGVEAEFTGRNDIVIDGKKVCGNAQAYKNDRIMHHGCLLFNTDLSVLSEALEIPKDMIDSKSVKSVRSAVANIKSFLKEDISVEDFSGKILHYMKQKFPEMEEYIFSEQELAEIGQIAETKFSSWDWNFGHSPKYTLTRNTRFTGGKIQVYLTVKNSVIEHIQFFGTFFGNNSDLSLVEEAFAGVKYTSEAIREKLATIRTAEFFAGFTVDELVEAIVQ
ncbi:MAG: lipoate protein ligase [Bacteroidetes bacterium]|nr:lipoate protein ligase [Bacteroidota bacterium]